MYPWEDIENNLLTWKNVDCVLSFKNDDEMAHWGWSAVVSMCEFVNKTQTRRIYSKNIW